jgi:hypothetical protein
MHATKLEGDSNAAADIGSISVKAAWAQCSINVLHL